MSSEKRVMLSAAVLLACLLAVSVRTEAKDKVKQIGNFKYTYMDYKSDGVWITEIVPVTGKGIKTLTIPSVLDGKKVVKLGSKYDTVNAGSSNMFGVYRSEDNEKIVPHKTANKVAKIHKIILPSTLKELTPNCLTYIQDGKSINIPAGVTKNIVNFE